MSAWQKKYYDDLLSNARKDEPQSGIISSYSLQNLPIQLRKCCNHPYLFFSKECNMLCQKEEEIVRASGKFELLDRLLPTLERAGHRVLLFSQMTRSIDILEEYLQLYGFKYLRENLPELLPKLERAGHRVLLFSQMTRSIDILEEYLQLYGFKYLRLDGSTKTEERGELVKKFNAPDSPYFIFLLSTRAGGLGLNLQSADTVIIFDSDWNPQMDRQAEDRAHRIGQKKEVRVFVLVSVGSIEEEILERAKLKMGIDAKVIQAGLFNTTSTANERRRLLQEIMQKGASTIGTCVPSEREINRLVARNGEEFTLFEQMDEERRQRERYRSRLMQENEIPDWVFTIKNPQSSSKSNPDPISNDLVIRKRKRKEVIYTLFASSDYVRNYEENRNGRKRSKPWVI